jgi:hypothetical protein
MIHIQAGGIDSLESVESLKMQAQDAFPSRLSFISVINYIFKASHWHLFKGFAVI